jgi:hypothetical protein
LYALRNSLAHDYSLVNARNERNSRHPLRWHCFVLDPEDHPIRFPSEAWDGVTYPSPSTSVGLRWVGNLAEEVKDRILERWHQDRLSLSCPVAEARARYGMAYIA